MHIKLYWKESVQFAFSYELRYFSGNRSSRVTLTINLAAME